MSYQFFLSPQVKRWTIITYKHGIYKLPHECKHKVGMREWLRKLLENRVNRQTDDIVPHPSNLISLTISVNSQPKTMCAQVCFNN